MWPAWVKIGSPVLMASCFALNPATGKIRWNNPLKGLT